MVTTPNRLEELVRLVESNAPASEIEQKKRQIITLQPIDLVIASRQLVEEAIQENEAQDARVEQFITANLG